MSRERRDYGSGMEGGLDKTSLDNLKKLEKIKREVGGEHVETLPSILLLIPL